MKLFFNCVEASTGYTSPFWLVETGLPFCFSLLSSRQAFKTMPVLPQQEKDRTSDVKIIRLIRCHCHGRWGEEMMQSY
jgi:hypothetical protein